MQQAIEDRLRSEIDREQARIEALRRNPSLLVPSARRHAAETLARLESVLRRARHAIDALSASAAGQDAERWGEEFGLAWRQLKSEMRLVASN